MLKDKGDLYNPYEINEVELRALNNLPEEAREGYKSYCEGRDKFYRAIAEARYRVNKHKKKPSGVFVLDEKDRYITTGAPAVIFKNGGCWYAVVRNPFEGAVNKELILTRIEGPQGRIKVVLDNQKYASAEGEEVVGALNYAGIPNEGAIFDRNDLVGIDISRFGDARYASGIARVRIKYGNEGGEVRVGDELVPLPQGEILIENMSPDKPIEVLPN